jgi:hypothetical protein|tara:strand:+ start:150 stop:434 length:285 start_codon:yes stop_codon:yes gene_type:complete
MAKEISEDSKFELSVKTLGGIAFMIFTLVSMWFMLQADIAEAKTLPEPLDPEVTRMEFQMKDENIRLSIKNTEDKVNSLENRLIRIEDKIDDLK